MPVLRHPLGRRTAILILARFAVVAAYVLAPEYVGHMMHVVPITADHGQTSVAGDRARSSTARAERLVARHDCWTGEAPAGTVPSRAVVTLPGRRAELARAQVGFDIWLDGRPGVVHAFCP